MDNALQRLLPREDPEASEPTKPKSQKSRDGCTTCKAKRRKCDETKPACLQCLRRRIPCGGYNKSLTWRHEGFENPRGPKSAASARKTRTRRTGGASKELRVSEEQLHTDRDSVDNSLVMRTDFSENTSHFRARAKEDSMPTIQTTPLADTGASASIDPIVDFDALLSGMSPLFQFPEDLPHYQQLTDFFNAEDSSSQLEEGTDIREPHKELGLEVAFAPRDIPTTSSLNLAVQGSHHWSRQPTLCDDSRENIGSIFIHRICEALCIAEAPTGNPWRQLVWPLAQKHIALYHALAAMTYFSALPSLRAKGLKHLETSLQNLSLCQGQRDAMPPEVAATTLLALAIAQTWYYPRSYNGTTHLKKARGLINALSINVANQKSPSIRFLTNTWMYMDVLTRITCPSYSDQTGDAYPMVELAPTSSEIDPETQVDPLMGCADTLFPLIGRVADLVCRIRKIPSSQKTNPPTIVSTAVDLLTAIDRWSPSIALQDLPPHQESVTPGASDLFQTANAYKWATILLLYQAVPELPCRLHYADIVRKILVFIATVPLSSKAVFFPIFPLMVAGCEATDLEDREWVRNRWRALSTLNGSGIADRCLEVTLEVWRRRNEFHSDGTVPRLDEATMDFSGVGSEFVVGHKTMSTTYVTEQSAGSLSRKREYPSRPIAIDGGGLGYETLKADSASPALTVRSDMHWLGVMRDWGWEVVLG